MFGIIGIVLTVGGFFLMHYLGEDHPREPIAVWTAVVGIMSLFIHALIA